MSLIRTSIYLNNITSSGEVASLSLVFSDSLDSFLDSSLDSAGGGVVASDSGAGGFVTSGVAGLSGTTFSTAGSVSRA